MTLKDFLEITDKDTRLLQSQTKTLPIKVKSS